MPEQGDVSERLIAGLHKPVADLDIRRPTGWRRHLGHAWYRLEKLRHERGLRTGGREVLIDHFHPDRVAYEPSGWGYLKRALSRRDVTPEDVFVDLGSGKGRVLCQAARYPFGRVVGVEVSAELNEVAAANVEASRHRFRCQDVELVTADAGEYAFPDDVTVVYLYYPFVGGTFGAVVRNLVASLDRAPREIRVVYVLPALESVLLETGRFHRVKEIPESWRGQRMAVYAGR